MKLLFEMAWRTIKLQRSTYCSSTGPFSFFQLIVLVFWNQKCTVLCVQPCGSVPNGGQIQSWNYLLNVAVFQKYAPQMKLMLLHVCRMYTPVSYDIRTTCSSCHQNSSDLTWTSTWTLSAVLLDVFGSVTSASLSFSASGNATRGCTGLGGCYISR